jgi:hypothetical protein
MVKLNACWRCVCVPPMKHEMAYKVTYGKVSGNLQKSVDLGRSITRLMNCVNKIL